MKKLFIPLLLITIVSVYAQRAPAWVTVFPYSSEYYTGIGSSKTGNKSADYTKALEQARVNLAAEISTSITSEITVETTDSSSGGFREKFTQEMKQVVEQNLREVEIVETWYSAGEGYWVYMRLSKSRWAEIRKRESDEMMNRISSIIDSSYFSTSITTSDKLYKLGSSASLLEVSPYREILTGRISMFYEGNILDFLLSETWRLSSSLTLAVTPERAVLSGDAPQLLRIKCRSEDYYTGKIPLTVTGNNNLSGEILTDINGAGSYSLEKNRLVSGDNRIKVEVNFLKFGYPDSPQYRQRFFITSAESHISKSAPQVFLKVSSNRDNFRDSDSLISSVFSRESSGFQLTDTKNDSSFSIDFQLIFTDYPRVLENAPIMAGITGNLKLKKDGSVLYEYTTGLFKDGGLNDEQAYSRAFRKMIDSMSSNQNVYLSDISEKVNQ